MASMTGQILIGHPNPNHGGINPGFYVYLSENNRPALILLPSSGILFTSSKKRKIVWIPTVEHMLEDALLMIAVHVINHPEVIDLITRFGITLEKTNLTLYDALTEEQRQQLYALCKTIDQYPKLIISVFKGSSWIAALPVLAEYDLDIEVCQPTYTRLWSQWSRDVTTQGSLEALPTALRRI